jgi:hypothetical protein
MRVQLSYRVRVLEFVGESCFCKDKILLHCIKIVSKFRKKAIKSMLVDHENFFVFIMCAKQYTGGAERLFFGLASPGETGKVSFGVSSWH